jgi:hypothetical protein
MKVRNSKNLTHPLPPCKIQQVVDVSIVFNLFLPAILIGDGTNLPGFVFRIKN